MIFCDGGPPFYFFKLRYWFSYFWFHLVLSSCLPSVFRTVNEFLRGHNLTNKLGEWMSEGTNQSDRPRGNSSKKGSK